eukprot:3445959-Pleurochrysis_carterae.AAC.1
MASVRARAADGALRTTSHSKSPPRRIKGKRVRCPWASGGSWRARTFANWQSMSAVDQSWPTDSNESRIEGTHRTPMSVYLSSLFRESRIVSGRSPTATQGRGRPSTPETDSVQGEGGYGKYNHCQRQNRCAYRENVDCECDDRSVALCASTLAHVRWTQCGDQRTGRECGGSENAVFLKGQAANGLVQRMR